MWLSQVLHETTFLSVVTIQEIRTGIDLLPAGRKRRDLDAWLTKDLPKAYDNRILPITAEIADTCGRLVANARKAGTTPDINDALIAATAVVHQLAVATLNRKHFERFAIDLVNF